MPLARFWLVFLCLSLSQTACDTGDDGRSGDLQSLEIEVPAGAGAGQPHLAVGDDGSVVLSWLEPGEDGTWSLRYALLEDERWSAPVSVGRGDNWFINWADFPSVVPMRGALLAAHWLERSGGSPYAYDVKLSLSGDGGGSWAPPLVPHLDGTRTEHGFVTLFPWRQFIGLVWLDGREMAQSPGPGQPGAPAGNHHGGDHGEAGMTLRYAFLDDDGNLVSDGLIDELTCDCCQTDVGVTAAGPLVVYRDRTGDEIRDIYASGFDGAKWSEPRPVATDDWRIAACPVNGPAIDAAGAHVAVAWFTGADDAPRIRLVFSADSGRHFDAPIELDGGTVLGRVDVVLLGDDEALVSWMAGTGAGAAEIRLARVTRDGRLQRLAFLATTVAARRSGFPQMTRSGDLVIVAWTDASNPSRVRSRLLRL